MLQWQPWLECQHSNTALGHMYALSDSSLQRACGQPSDAAGGDPSWAMSRVLLQRLYSKASRVRHAAAKRLVLQVAGGPGLLEDKGIEGAPLRICPSLPQPDVSACKCA
jgi:hypothetical protein